MACDGGKLYQEPLLDCSQDDVVSAAPRSTIANRAVSCQLPAINEEDKAGPIHRPSQSIDLGSTQVHISWSAPRGCKAESVQLPRYERKKASNALLAIQIAALLLLVPVAFVAGYALASNSKAPSTACPIALSRTGAKRQLSHDESATTQHLSAAGGTGQALMPVDEPSTVRKIPETQILFVTWIAFGEFGDGGFHTHNFHKVDMRWAEVARKSHPGCKIGLIMDQDTLLQDTQSVDFLHRLTIDKKVYGRNEYNDYYHWTARHSFLEKLMADGEDKYNVVFVDPDVFVVGDIQEVFDHSGFDYATTISENPWQPINGAMHFVRAHRYGAAVDVLKGVLSKFQLRPDMGFTAGQQAYADFFELTDNEALIKQMQWDSVEKGIGCNAIMDGDFSICYFICTIYNHWEDCSDHPDMHVRAEEPEDYKRVDVKVFHFVAYRKLGMQRVYDAFIAQGLPGAQQAWAALPHTEDGFDLDPSFADEA